MPDDLTLPPLKVNLGLVSNEDLITEIKTRFPVCVILTCNAEDSEQSGEYKTFDFKGGLTLCCGLADLFVRRSRLQLTQDLVFRPAGEDDDE